MVNKYDYGIFVAIGLVLVACAFILLIPPEWGAKLFGG